MSIKPVAWMHKDGSVITAEKKKKAEQSSSIQAAMVSGYATPLHAIPDTHRVVSVELLSRIMELAGVALVYQPFGTKDRQHFDALMAIIKDNRS